MANRVIIKLAMERLAADLMSRKERSEVLMIRICE